MDTFKNRLKTLRFEKNLTQKALAEALSVTISTLSHWECGYQEPSFKDLISICDFFEVQIDYLLGRSDDFGNVTVKKESSPSLTPEEQNLLNAFRLLPREERMQAAEYVQFLAERRGTKNKNA